MVWPFQFLQKLCDTVAISYPKRKRRHLEGLGLGFSPRIHQAEAEQTIDGGLEGVARLTHLLLDQHGDVVVDRESGSHIMMIRLNAS